MTEESKDKLIRWWLFVGIFSLLPFLLSAMVWQAKHHDDPHVKFHIYFLWERGELLVLSIGFAADALGECLSRQAEFYRLRLYAAAACVFMLLIEIGWFVLLQSFSDAYDPIWITCGSLMLFLITLGTAGVCRTAAAKLEEVTNSQGVAP